MVEKQYRTTEEKVRDIERYLIQQVDTIRRWVLVAVCLAAVAALASLWMAVTAGDGGEAPRTTPVDRQSAPLDPVKPAETAPRPPSDPAARAGDAALAPARRDPARDAAEAPAPYASAVGPTSSAPPAGTERATSSRTPTTMTARSSGFGSTAQPSGPGAAASSATGSAAPGFRAASITVSTGIQGMQPVGTSDRFPATTQRIYCWSRIEADEFGRIPSERRYVVHRWYREGQLERSRKITIGASRYRAWSSLSSPGEKPGNWRVDVTDADGRVLGSLRFSVESGS